MSQPSADQHDTYKQNYGSTGSRETDMRALLKYAGLLHEALLDGGKNMEAYKEAIRENQRLWTIFQVAIVDPKSNLPQTLRQQLFTISRYIDRVSLKAIRNFNPDALVSLIGINRTLARGLNRNTASTTSAPPNQAPPPTPDPAVKTSFTISA